MERIAEKLSEIEKTARAIVDNAQEQKHQMEMQMQKKRDTFDADMEKETNEKILKIQSDLATNMEKLLKKQEEQNNNEIESLKQDFKEHHSEYAKQILERVIKVQEAVALRDVMRYSGIVTKVAAMRAKLLKPQDYEQLASMNTVTDIIEYLKQTKSYGKFITQMDESLYHRGNIEKVLIQSLYDDYTRLYRFADMQQKDFLKTFMKRYEVDLIRYCLRIVFNHSNVPFDLNYKKPFFDKYSKIRIDQLVTAKNIDHLVDYLKNTEYYAPLSRIRQSGASTLADYELALDLYYFSMMWKERKGNWDKKDKEMLTKELGAKIDLLNLQWIYRAKKYYHMLAPDIYTLLIPIQHKLSNQEFKDLVEAPSVEEFKRRLNETYYGKKYEFGEQVQIESIVNECVEHILTIAYRNHPYSLASIQQYLFLKEEEIYKITTALECIRYGLSQRETLRYLVREQRRQGGNAS